MISHGKHTRAAIASQREAAVIRRMQTGLDPSRVEWAAAQWALTLALPTPLPIMGWRQMTEIPRFGAEEIS
jgi:hypothetical protein